MSTDPGSIRTAPGGVRTAPGGSGRLLVGPAFTEHYLHITKLKQVGCYVILKGKWYFSGYSTNSQQLIGISGGTICGVDAIIPVAIKKARK